MSKRKQTTTITISEENYRRLIDLKIEKKHDGSVVGRRVDFNDVISLLISEHDERSGEKSE